MRKIKWTLLFVVFVTAMLVAFASCGNCAHKNTEVEGAVAATCSTAGHTGKTVCKDCGATVSEGETIATLAHTYDEGVVTVKATCYQTGVKTLTCTVCTATNVESIPVVPHADVYHDALDNTHSHTCIHCTINEYEQHTPVDGGTYHEATCVEPAYTLLTCADCDGEYKVYDEGGEALGHEYGAWTVTLAATCKAAGETAHTCGRCGDTETIALSVNPNAHKYDDGTVTTEPTCCDVGVKTFTCTLCGDRSKTEDVAITAHQYDDGENSNGWITQTCTTCTVENPATRKYYDASTLTTAELDVSQIPTEGNLELGMENATLQVPQDVVSQLGTAEKVEIKADFMDDSTKETLLSTSTALTEEEKARLENVDVYDFGISVGGNSIGTFDAVVTVTIPYTLKDGEDAEGILIWYVKDNGQLENVTAAYNATTESVTFSVSHFSYYAVAYQETQAMKCRRGVHDLKATDIVSAPSCTSYGYTVHECSYCHHLELGNLAPKLDHEWGEIQQPTVTCTEGGYSYRECATCHGHVNITYVRANGHTVVGSPTCESGVSCSVCEIPVKPALGHDFTDWTVTVKPTPISEGEKTRTCRSCDRKETVALAKEGTVEAYEFETVDDLYIYMLREMSGLEKGQLTLAFNTNGMTVNATIDFDTTGEKLVFIMEAVQEQLSDEGGSEMSVVNLYYDGARVFSNTNGEIYITDLEGLMASEGVTMELIMGLMEEAFDLANPTVEEYLGVAADVLAVLPTEAAKKLSTYVDSIETVYAYHALRLGFDTNVKLAEGVKVPTAQDYKNFIEALMVEDEENPGTYTFTDEKIAALIDEITTYLDENAETAMGALVYDAIAETVAEIYPDVTDYESLLATLKTEFTGTMTVKDALLKLVRMALSADMTMQDVYEAIDVVLNMNAPEGSEPVSSEVQLAAMLNMTLDEALAMLTADPETGEPSGLTVEVLFAMLESAAATKLSEIAIPIPSGSGEEAAVITAAMISETMKQIKAMIALDLDVTVVLDHAGKLVSVDCGIGIGINPPEEAPEGTEPTELFSVSIAFSDAPDLTVPESLAPYAGIDVKTSFDEKGNLIVSGLDADMGFLFELYGSHVYQLSDILVKDAALSAELGYDVWKLDARYSDSSMVSFELCVINGKYYTYSHVDEFLEETKVEGRVSLDDFLADPLRYLPAADAEVIGVIGSVKNGYDGDDNGSLESMPQVYYTYGGAVYQKDGVWHLIDLSKSAYDWYSFWDSEKEEDVRLYVFDEQNLVSAPYAEAMAEVSFESLKDYNQNDEVRWLMQTLFGDRFVNGAWTVNLYCGEFGVVTCLAEKVGNEINLLLPEIRLNEDEYYYVIGEEVDIENLESLLDSYDGKPIDFSQIHITTDDGWWTGGTFVMNGVVRPERNMELLHVEFHVAEYFREVEDGVYVSLGKDGKSTSYIGFADVSMLPTVDVAGRTLYKKGESNGYTYGYVKLPTGEYAQVCARDGVITYRGGESKLRVYLDELYDVADYVTKTAGGYVISADLLKSLDGLMAEGEIYSLQLSDDGTSEDVYVEIPVYSNAKTPDVSIRDLLGNMMGGTSDEGDHKDWWSWFPSIGYNSITVSPNADGTVSVFTSNGDEISFEYAGKEFLVGPFATYKKTEDGYSFYEATQKYNHYSVSFVKLNGKYYSYNDRSEYSLSYYSGASQINCKSWELHDLTLAIPAENKEDTNAFDIYVGDVYFPSLSSGAHQFYFIYDGGVLKVLTGVVRQDGETDAIQYEGAVPATTYFSALKADVKPDSYWYSFSCYVGGVMKDIYNVSVELVEPASLGGYDEDTAVSYDSIRATKNGSRFSYIKSLERHGQSKLILGKEFEPEDGWVERDLGEDTYQNGSFSKVDFFYKTEQTYEYVKLAGKLYYTEAYYDDWKNYLYSEEAMKEALYDKVYLWKDNNGDGTVYIADESGYSLEVYEGDLDTANADKIAPNVSISGEDSWTKYTFYVSTEDVEIAVTQIDGCTAHYNTANSEGFVEVKDGVYARAYFDTWSGEPTIQRLADLSLGYASSATIAESDIIKDNVTSTQNGKVIVVKKGILDVLGADFYMYVRNEEGNNIGSVWYEELLLAFDRAEILKNGGSLTENGDSTPEKDETMKT